MVRVSLTEKSYAVTVTAHEKTIFLNLREKRQKLSRIRV